MRRGGKVVDTEEYFRIKRDKESAGWQVIMLFWRDSFLTVLFSSITIAIWTLHAAKIQLLRYNTGELIFIIVFILTPQK